MIVVIIMCLISLSMYSFDLAAAVAVWKWKIDEDVSRSCNSQSKLRVSDTYVATAVLGCYRCAVFAECHSKPAVLE